MYLEKVQFAGFHSTAASMFHVKKIPKINPLWDDDPKAYFLKRVVADLSIEQSMRYQMNYPDLKNKTILLYLFNRPDEHNVVLQDATLENQAGKMFIVGVFAEGTTANDWAAGVRTAVAWDSVEQYLIFDTIDNYFERISIGWEKKTVQ